MTWQELVRHYFPEASDEMADTILWEWTGYPIFWITNRWYPTPVARCRQQLRALKYRLSKKEGENGK